MEHLEKRKVRAVTAILALLMVCLLAGCSQKTDDTVAPYQEEEVQEEVILPPVEISRPEYELTYSGELKDIIIVKELTEEAGGLDFFVQLSKEETRIFTLHYNTNEGEFVTVLTDHENNRIPVAFEMMAVPENLSEEDAELFYLAQDAVNEIAESLELK